MTPGSLSLFLAAATVLLAAVPHAACGAFLLGVDWTVNDDHGQATSSIDCIATSSDAGGLTLSTRLCDWGLFPTENRAAAEVRRAIDQEGAAWPSDVPIAPSAAFNGAALASGLVLLAAIDDASEKVDLRVATGRRGTEVPGSRINELLSKDVPSEAPPVRGKHDESGGLGLTAAFDFLNWCTWAEPLSTGDSKLSSWAQDFPEPPTLALVGVGLF
jgi:hypothetical protein